MNKFIGLLVLSCLACAQAPVRVGVMTASQPFAWEKEDGTFEGVSVALWEEVAREHSLRYKLLPAGPNIGKALERLKHQDFDVLVGPISVTGERYKDFEFSRPYFLNHLSVAVPVEKGSSRWAMLGQTLWEPIAHFFPIFLVVITLVSLGFFLFDRKVQHRKVSSWRGFMDSMWEVVIILIQGELLADTRHVGKRFLVILWLVLSIGLLSIFIGTITSSLTLFDEKMERSYRVLRSDLESERVVVVRGSVGAKEAVRAMALPVPVDSREEALDLLRKQKVFGIVDDFMLLKSMHAKHKFIRVTRLNLKNDEVAFVFRKGTHLSSMVNTTLLSLQDSGSAESICRPYLGEDAVLCLL